MEKKPGKRKKQMEVVVKPKRAKATRTRALSGEQEVDEPYPAHLRPSREECEAVRDSLLRLHGFPSEFAKYRDQRQSKPSGLPLDGGEESVLDGLIRTVLSQNTTEANSQKAFTNLKAAFPSWQDVVAAELKSIEDAIRCGGLAPTKASCIKNVLNLLLRRRGKLCLEYLRYLSVHEIKAELSCFKGVGPKTVACVLMFNLHHDDFPVDTHVFQIARAIGWVPDTADRKKTYFHLNQRIPNELKFDLNCLLYTHGKICRKCIKRGANQQGKDPCNSSCPLLNYSIKFSPDVTVETNR